MMFRWAVIFLILVLSSTRSSHAQESERWHWAIDPNQGILAFNPNGEVRVLSDPLSIERSVAWRVNDRLALALISINGQRVLYNLSNEHAVQMEVNFPLDEAFLLSTFGNYSLLSTPYQTTRGPFSDLLLVDPARGRATVLTDVRTGWYHFTQSDHFIYGRLNFDNPINALFLIDYDLNTGNEQIVYTFDPAPSNLIFSNDATFVVVRESPINNIWLTSITAIQLLSGEREILAEYDSREAPYMDFQVWGDQFVYYYPSSPESNEPITINIQPLNGGDTTSFVSTQPFQFIGAAPQSDGEFDGFLLITNNGEMWWLGRNENLTPLGIRTYANNFYIIQRSPLAQPYVITQPTDQADQSRFEFHIWNIVDGEPQLMTTEVTTSSGLSALPNGEVVLITDGVQFHAIAANDSLLRLPAVEGGGYYEAVSPTSALYSQISISTDDNRPIGIYLYDAEDNEFTLLIENASPLYTLSDH